MDRNKIAAILCAIIAFLLVVMAGKSCSQSIDEKNKANRSKATQAADPTAENDETPEGKTSPPQNIQYDLFGRPVIPTEAPAEEIEPVTDGDGNVIEPETETITDENGNVMETVTDNESDETSEEASEAGNQFPTAPPGFSGFDHREYDSEGNEIATIPPDFVIVIE